MAEVNEVPGGGLALDGGILAHGGDRDAIGQGEAAQVDRREENAHFGDSKRAVEVAPAG